MLLGEATAHCHVQTFPRASFLRQGLDPQCPGLVQSITRILQLTSPYFTSLEILCFITFFLKLQSETKEKPISSKC